MSEQYTYRTPRLPEKSQKQEQQPNRIKKVTSVLGTAAIGGFLLVSAMLTDQKGGGYGKYQAVELNDRGERAVEATTELFSDVIGFFRDDSDNGPIYLDIDPDDLPKAGK